MNRLISRYLLSIGAIPAFAGKISILDSYPLVN